MSTRWRVCFTRRDLRCPVAPMPFLRALPAGLEPWLDSMDILDGTPFLLSPALEYDVELNGFFHRPAMVGSAWNTQAG